VLVGKDGQAMPSTSASRFEDIASVFILHSLAKAMNTQAAAVFRLKGSFHFRLLLLKYKTLLKKRKRRGSAKVRRFTEQKGQHRAAGMRHYPAKIPR
jgi:hypothetical protein